MLTGSGEEHARAEPELMRERLPPIEQDSVSGEHEQRIWVRSVYALRGAEECRMIFDGQVHVGHDRDNWSSDPFAGESHTCKVLFARRPNRSQTFKIQSVRHNGDLFGLHAFRHQSPLDRNSVRNHRVRKPIDVDLQQCLDGAPARGVAARCNPNRHSRQRRTDYPENIAIELVGLNNVDLALMQEPDQSPQLTQHAAVTEAGQREFNDRTESECFDFRAQGTLGVQARNLLPKTAGLMQQSHQLDRLTLGATLLEVADKVQNAWR
jgi:hypothetical protein